MGILSITLLTPGIATAMKDKVKENVKQTTSQAYQDLNRRNLIMVGCAVVLLQQLAKQSGHLFNIAQYLARKAAERTNSMGYGVGALSRNTTDLASKAVEKTTNLASYLASWVDLKSYDPYERPTSSENSTPSTNYTTSTALSTLSGRVTALTTRVHTLENADYAGRIGTLENAISGHAQHSVIAQLEALGKRGEAWDAGLLQLGTDITRMNKDLTGKYDTLNGAVEDLTGQYVALNTKVGTLETTIGTLATQQSVTQGFEEQRALLTNIQRQLDQYEAEEDALSDSAEYDDPEKVITPADF